MTEPIKYAQIYIAIDALADWHEGTETFSLHFPTEEGGSTAVVDLPTLKRFQGQIADALKLQSEVATDL